MPEQQFLACRAQVVHVANVVTIPVHIVQDNPARGWALDIFAQVLRGKWQTPRSVSTVQSTVPNRSFAATIRLRPEEIASLQIFVD